MKNRLSTRPVVILRRCSGHEIAERTLLVGLGSTSFRSARFSAGDKERDLAPAASGKSESANCSLEGLAAHPMSGKQIHKPRRGGGTCPFEAASPANKCVTSGEACSFEGFTASTGNQCITSDGGLKFSCVPRK